MSDTDAVATVKVDNARVRVTEWRFAPRRAHRPSSARVRYVVVPLTTGSLTAHRPRRARHQRAPRRQPYYRDAGVAPDVRNANSSSSPFIEIELKDA